MSKGRSVLPPAVWPAFVPYRIARAMACSTSGAVSASAAKASSEMSRRVLNTVRLPL